MQRGHDRRWEMAILCSAGLWGTLWIPLRALRATGSGDASTTTIGFLVPLILLAPFAAGRFRRILGGGWPLGRASLFLAVAIALYAEGLVLGQVARVILLFYLMPVWSTVLGRLLLDAPITGRRIGAILLGLAGLAVIFGAEAGTSTSPNAGDWMGLTGGFAWALGAIHLNRVADRPLFDRVFAQFVFLAPIFLLVASTAGGAPSLGAGAEPLLRAVPWLLALSLVWMLPVMWLTIAGASRLDPGRSGILLMAEIVVGLATAAWLTDEPFGLREALGAGLILAASGAELLPGRRP